MTSVLITGDRNWVNIDVIRASIKELGTISLLIHGGCRGADSLAGQVAKELKVTTSVHPYKKELGLRGGPVRNKEMVDILKGRSDKRIVLAFHDDLSSSKGTKNCVGIALKAALPVLLINSKGQVCEVK